MIIVVSDANIIVDLLQINLFNAFLKRDWQKHVPPDVTEEVQEPNSLQLSNAISSEEIFTPSFSSGDLSAIQKLKTRYASLLFADCACILLARKMSAILLTGERKLRSIASDNYKLEVHGTLWAMEKLLEAKIITYRKAYKKLSQLMKINDRLPQKECIRLLKSWKKNSEPLPPPKPPVITLFQS
jgi:predicted nucleic acid-binding protein